MVTRRAFLFGGVGAAAPAMAGGAPLMRPSWSTGRVQTSVDLFGPEPRADHALRGWNTSDYGWPGSALTASTRTFWWNVGIGPLVAARWLVAWNPQGDPRASIRLVSFAETHSLTVLSVISTDGLASLPRGEADWVTEGLQAARDAGAGYVGHQLRGNPIIFQSTLELVWEV